MNQTLIKGCEERKKCREKQFQQVRTILEKYSSLACLKAKFVNWITGSFKLIIVLGEKKTPIPICVKLVLLSKIFMKIS